MNETGNGKMTGIYLLVGKEERQSKTGNVYYELTLGDKKDRITAKDFNRLAAAIPLSAAVRATLSKNDKYGYSVDAMQICPEYGVQDFIRHPPMRESVMYDEILSKLRRLCDGNPRSIAAVAALIYEENREKLLRWSAAKQMHHNFCGGLLYHTYRMMRLAAGMISTYPDTDAELLFTAVSLHDIGKLSELTTDDFGECDYSVAGGLLGHALIGIEMINEAARHVPCDEEKLLLLKHCLASHHGEYEYGAITKPATLEAFLLHIIDLTDSRVYMYENEYVKLEPGARTEKKVFGVDTAVYRPAYTEGKAFRSDYSDKE